MIIVAYDADDDMRTRDRGTNWLLWGGLALIVILVVLALPLLGDLGEQPAQPQEEELAEEEQEPQEPGPTTGDNNTTMNDTAEPDTAPIQPAG